MEATTQYGSIAVSHAKVSRSRSAKKFNAYFWLQVAGLVAASALGTAALAWAAVVMITFGSMAMRLFELVAGLLIG